MIMAIDIEGALFIFASTEDAEQDLEAIDVQQFSLEFCDGRGQRYLPVYTHPPTKSRLGPIAIVDIGAFKLKPQGDVDPSLTRTLVERARYIEHSSLPSITTLEELQNELHNQS
jgi:hypothetical protein